MTLQNLRNKQIIVSRLTTVSGNKRAYATLTAAYVELQPASREKVDMFGGAMGKLFNCYADISADILEADMLRETSSGNLYKVKTGGVSKRSQGSIDYLQIVVEQIN